MRCESSTSMNVDIIFLEDEVQGLPCLAGDGTWFIRAVQTIREYVAAD